MLTFSRFVVDGDVMSAVVVEYSEDVVAGSGIFSASLLSRRLQKVFLPWKMRPSLSMDLSNSSSSKAALAAGDWEGGDVTEFGILPTTLH